jgi:hypothetical protein
MGEERKNGPRGSMTDDKSSRPSFEQTAGIGSPLSVNIAGELEPH